MRLPGAFRKLFAVAFVAGIGTVGVQEVDAGTTEAPTDFHDMTAPRELSKSKLEKLLKVCAPDLDRRPAGPGRPRHPGAGGPERRRASTYRPPPPAFSSAREPAIMFIMP